jgi:hypothetical protein
MSLDTISVKSVDECVQSLYAVVSDQITEPGDSSPCIRITDPSLAVGSSALKYADGLPEYATLQLVFPSLISQMDELLEVNFRVSDLSFQSQRQPAADVPKIEVYTRKQTQLGEVRKLGHDGFRGAQGSIEIDTPSLQVGTFVKTDTAVTLTWVPEESLTKSTFPALASTAELDPYDPDVTPVKAVELELCREYNNRFGSDFKKIVYTPSSNVPLRELDTTTDRYLVVALVLTAARYESRRAEILDIVKEANLGSDWLLSDVEKDLETLGLINVEEVPSNSPGYPPHQYTLTEEAEQLPFSQRQEELVRVYGSQQPSEDQESNQPRTNAPKSQT